MCIFIDLKSNGENKALLLKYLQLRQCKKFLLFLQREDANTSETNLSKARGIGTMETYNDIAGEGLYFIA